MLQTAGHHGVSWCGTKAETQGPLANILPQPNVNKTEHPGFETKKRFNQKSESVSFVAPINRICGSQKF